MRTFIVWMEYTLAKRQLIHSLLVNLGLSPKANPESISLNDFTPDKLKDAIEKLNIAADAKPELLKLIPDEEGESGETLNTIVQALNPMTMNKQNKSISQPINLPPGQGQVPKPPNPNNQQQPNAAGQQIT